MSSTDSGGCGPTAPPSVCCGEMCTGTPAGKRSSGHCLPVSPSESEPHLRGQERLLLTRVLAFSLSLCKSLDSSDAEARGNGCQLHPRASESMELLLGRPVHECGLNEAGERFEGGAKVCLAEACNKVSPFSVRSPMGDGLEAERTLLAVESRRLPGCFPSCATPDRRAECASSRAVKAPLGWAEARSEGRSPFGLQPSDISAVGWPELRRRRIERAFSTNRLPTAVQGDDDGIVPPLLSPGTGSSAMSAASIIGERFRSSCHPRAAIRDEGVSPSCGQGSDTSRRRTRSA
eukprot:scaffold15885_cov127-Isochrysis_galbana.AAC.1